MHGIIIREIVLLYTHFENSQASLAGVFLMKSRNKARYSGIQQQNAAVQSGS
jgi:hypothetical protein